MAIPGKALTCFDRLAVGAVNAVRDHQCVPGVLLEEFLGVRLDRSCLLIPYDLIQGDLAKTAVTKGCRAVIICVRLVIGILGLGSKRIAERDQKDVVGNRVGVDITVKGNRQPGSCTETIEFIQVVNFLTIGGIRYAVRWLRK